MHNVKLKSPVGPTAELEFAKLFVIGEPETRDIIV